MIELYQREEIVKAEKALFDKGVTALSLIQKAGRGILSQCENFHSILIVVGAGNNGSDGYEAGILLKNLGKCVTVCRVKSKRGQDNEYLSQKYQEQYKIYDWKEVDFSSYDCIVDCIFGIGLNREVEGEYKEVIERINSSGKFVLSADIPSGLNADTGKVMGVAVKANKTISFLGMKVGYILSDGQDFTGDIVFCDTGIYPQKPCAMLVDDINLKERKKNTHKGSYGKVSLITGSANYVGAAVLSAQGALRSGAGLVRLCVPESLKECYQKRIIEPVLTFLPDDGEKLVFQKERLDEIINWSDCIAIGMGIGQSEGVRECVEYVVKNAKCPVVVDADGLNALTGDLDILKLSHDIVLTPHLGEFARLTKKAVSEIDYIGDSLSFASTYGVCVHLKGCASVTAYPDGQVYITSSGTPAMAKGGSGDVLSGITASFIAQKIENPVVSASIVHGEAGKIASEKFGEYGTLARDIAEAIPYALKNLDSKKL